MPSRANVQLHLTPISLAAAALMLLILPLPWIGAAIAAAAWHELCHCAAVWSLGGRINGIQFHPNGTVINSTPLSPWRSLVCSLAGPAGSIILLFFLRWFPRTALCGLFHGAYNLLPVYPLDGGRALRSALQALLRSDSSDRICCFTEMVTMLLLCVLCLYCALILKLGFMPLVMTAVLLLRVKYEKILANSGFTEYNSNTIHLR